jgi:predicted Zn-dependent peptidase
MNSRALRWDYDFERRTTANGLRVVTVRQPHLHRGTISVYLGAGSRFETPEENGLSHFLEHMVFRGTERFPTAFALNVAVERLGGTLVASTAPDVTEFSMSLPRESLAHGLDLMAEVLMRPRFDAVEIERRIVAEEIREDLDEDDRDIDIDHESRGRLWPGHALGRSVIGPIENVSRFEVADLRRCLERRYAARNAVLCVTGCFDPAAIRGEAERAFAGMARGELQRYDAAPGGTTGPSATHVDKTGSQTAVRIAFRAPGLNDPDVTAAELLLRLLDDGMSTPLHRRVFEDRGLAYNVGSDLELYADTGALNLDAVCSHGNVVQVAEEILAILVELRDAPIADADLEKAKRRAIWSLERHLDDPEAMNLRYGEQELIAGARGLEDEALAISALDAAAIARVARRIVRTEDLHITTVGALGEKPRRALERLAGRGV